eukprot:scaffold254090_cov18-Tisochrysis_lutea.AAC.1
MRLAVKLRLCTVYLHPPTSAKSRSSSGRQHLPPHAPGARSLHTPGWGCWAALQAWGAWHGRAGGLRAAAWGASPFGC